MKHIFLTLLFCVPMALFAQDNGQPANNSNERSFEQMLENLQRVHKLVYDLPYEYAYIKDTLMPQLEAERKKIAPHYPDRMTTGADHDTINKHFQDWFLNYPNESEAYIKYVEQFIRSHKKTN